MALVKLAFDVKAGGRPIDERARMLFLLAVVLSSAAFAPRNIHAFRGIFGDLIAQSPDRYAEQASRSAP
jgi:hypothetical protein